MSRRSVTSSVLCMLLAAVLVVSACLTAETVLRPSIGSSTSGHGWLDEGHATAVSADVPASQQRSAGSAGARAQLTVALAAARTIGAESPSARDALGLAFALPLRI